MTALPMDLVTNFVQGILGKDEVERAEIFSLIENNISNNDYNIHNYLKGTKGRNPEAGLIWIVWQLIEQQNNNNVNLKESLSESFHSFVNNNNTMELADYTIHNTGKLDIKHPKEKVLYTPPRTIKQNIKTLPKMILDSVNTNGDTKTRQEKSTNIKKTN